MRRALLCACGIVLSQSVFAQGIAIPGSGVIFDAATHGLRSINGIAGSATLGPSLRGAADLTNAAVCSWRDFAVVTRDSGARASIFKFDNSPAASLPSDVLNSPDQVVLNTSCSAALLFSAAAGQIQLIGGLPDSLVISASFPLQLAGVCRDALIADSAGNRILAVSSVLFSPVVQVLASQDAGISSPDAIAYSTLRQQILIGNRGTSSIGLFSAGNNAINLLPCGCQGSFSSLGNNTYEVAAPVNGLPLLVFDANAFPSKVLFVPARQ